MLDEERIEILLEKWEAARDRGETLTPEQICAADAELLPELRSRIGLLSTLDRFVGEAELQHHEAGTPFQLGRFKLQDLIGEGGFGQVWKARDTELDRDVAVKILHPQWQSSPYQVERFTEEAKKAAQLDHPNIVTVHDFGRDGENCYLVTALVDGLNLAEWMAAHPISQQAAARLVAEIADGLQHAHDQGVIHRDVKPRNILVAPHGKSYITDFGIAVTAAELQSTQPSPAGTRSYMSPEQRSAQGEIDARTDVYSLGVILHEMLTGQLPCSGDGQPVPSLRNLNSAISPELDKSCLKALAIDLDQRWSSAKEFGDALRSIEFDSRPKWRGAVIGLSMLLLAVLAVAAVSSRRPTAKPTRPAKVATPDPSREPKTESLNQRRVTGKLLATHTHEITSCTFSPDGKSALATATHQPVLLIDLETSTVIRSFDHNARLAFFNSPDRIVSVGRKGRLRTWDSNLGNQVAESSFRGCRWRASLSADAQLVAYTTTRYASLLDLNKQEDVWEIPGANAAFGIAISQDGSFIAVGDAGGRIRLWSVASRSEFGTLPQLRGYVQAVAISPDNQHLLVGSWDGTLRLFAVESGQKLHEYAMKMPMATTFSADGKFFAAGGSGVIRVWSTNGQTEVMRVKAHDGKEVTALSFSADGRWLISGGRDKCVRLWKVPNPETDTRTTD